jgi:hypothetical protein
MIMKVDGSETVVRMNLLFVPGFWIPIFTLTAALSKAVSLINDNNLVV